MESSDEYGPPELDRSFPRFFVVGPVRTMHDLVEQLNALSSGDDLSRLVSIVEEPAGFSALFDRAIQMVLTTEDLPYSSLPPDGASQTDFSVKMA